MNENVSMHSERECTHVRVREKERVKIHFFQLEGIDFQGNHKIYCSMK